MPWTAVQGASEAVAAQYMFKVDMAPSDHGLKEVCKAKGAKLGSARIPVMELKLSTVREDGNVKRLDYCISESMWPEGPRGWLLFPLVEVLSEGSSTSVDKLPESEAVRHEMWERFRALCPRR